MASKNGGTDKRGRLAASLAAKLPFDDGGGYEYSAAFTPSLVKRFLGDWILETHEVDGVPWIEGYAESALGGADFQEPVYYAGYSFDEKVCVKKVLVRGRLGLDEGHADYEYRMSVVLEWEPLAGGELRAMPVLGYQLTSLDGVIASVKEFGGNASEIVLKASFEQGYLVLAEGPDRKVLRKAP